MSVTSDILYEILQQIDYRDISNWCQSSLAFAAFCRTERGQTTIRRKQQAYKEEQITAFLDSLSIDERKPSPFVRILTMRLKDQNILEPLWDRHIELLYKLPKGDLRTNKMNYDLLFQVLLEYYELFPIVKRIFEQNKYGSEARM